MGNQATDRVTMTREHYNAVRRVLKLLRGYIGAMPNHLHGYDGGMMTSDELWEHADAACKLMRPKARKHRG